MSKQVILDYSDHEKLLKDVEAFHDLKNTFRHTIEVLAKEDIQGCTYRTERILVPRFPIDAPLPWITLFQELDEVVKKNEEIRSDIYSKAKEVEKDKEVIDVLQIRLLKYYRKLTELYFKERVVYLFTGNLPGRINENI